MFAHGQLQVSGQLPSAASDQINSKQHFHVSTPKRTTISQKQSQRPSIIATERILPK